MTKGGARNDQRGAARRNDQESAQNDDRASGVRMCANCASYLWDAILDGRGGPAIGGPGAQGARTCER
jgi:hypothetical protein